MLERGVASIEPSVQRLITQIERPVRSKKLLGQTFWYRRHGSAPVAPWWPQFLEATKVTGDKHADANGTIIPGQNAPHLDFLYPRPRPQPSPIQVNSEGYKRPQHSRQRQVRCKSVSQNYSTTSKQAQSVAADQVGSVNDGDVAALGKDFWHQRAQLDGVLTEAEPPADEVNQLLPAGPSNNVAQIILTPHQIIERYNQAKGSQRSFDQRQLVVNAALEIGDFVLVKHLVMTTAAKDGFRALFKFALEHMIEKECFKDAASFFSSAKDRDVWNVPIFNKKNSISAVLPAKALKLLQEIDPLKMQPYNRRTVLFKELAAFLLVQMMRSPQIMSHITPEGLTTLTSSYDEAEILAPNALIPAFKTIKKMAKHRSRPDIAILVYRILRQRFPDWEVPPYVYGSLISNITESVTSDSWASGTEALKYVLSEFARMHGKADRQAYQRALTAFARMGDVKAVNEVYEDFCKVHGETDNPAILNPLLYVHARLGNVNEAQKRFDWLMETIGHTPGVTVWNTLLSAFARIDDLKGALGIFRRMIAADIKPDEYTFGTIMGICARSKDAESVLYVAKEAESHGIRLTFPMMDCLVRTHCQNDEVELAEKVAESASTPTAGQGPIRLWNSILTHFAHRADTQNILRIQNRMKQLKISPNGMTYAALMLSLTKIGQTKNARDILRALHFSGHTKATVTHYAIVMHGFAREGRRDEVTALYLELLERVRKPNLSASLAMLKSLIKRDVKRWDGELALLVGKRQPIQDGQNQLARARLADAKKMHHASKFLDHILSSLDVKELASKGPKPSVGHFKVTDMIPGELFRVMIHVFGKRGLFTRVRELLWKYRQAREHMTQTIETMPDFPVQLLAATMEAASMEKDHSQVEEIWRQFLLRAIREGRSRKPMLDEWKEDKIEQISSETHDNGTLSDPLEEPGLQIPYAQRFALAPVLNNMLYSLACRKQYSKISQLIERLQRVGFDLDSHNWNKYVQLMALSESPEHQFLAFTTFQEKLLKNMPPWDLMVKGKAVVSEPGNDQFSEDDQFNEEHFSEEDEPVGEIVNIRTLAFMKRAEIYPRYFTLVFLGRALLRFRERSRSDHGAELHRLLKVARDTVITVAKMPYLKDRVQGVLLRGRDVTGDLFKLKPASRRSKTLGLLGSRSIVDRVPTEKVPDLVELQRLAFDDNHDSMALKDKEDELLELSYGIFGDLEGNNKPPLKDPGQVKRTTTESGVMVRSNVPSKVEKIRELLLGMKEPTLMADELSGEPSFDGMEGLSATNDELSITSPSENPEQTIRTHTTSEGQKILFYSDEPGDVDERSYEPQLRKIRTRTTRGFDSYRYSVFDKLSLKIYRSRSPRNRIRAFSRNKRLARQRSVYDNIRRRGIQNLPYRNFHE